MNMSLNPRVHCWWLLAASLLVGNIMTLQAKWLTIHNDFTMYDSDGNSIQTRSGCLCKFGETYYWYGWKGTNQNCYASTDLLHWTKKGVIYTGSEWTNRMDVVYNDQSKQYILILKYASGDACNLGIATCSTPDGKFNLKGNYQVFGHQICDMSVFKDDDNKLYLAYVWNSVADADCGGVSEHALARFKPDYLNVEENLQVWHRGSREANMMMKHHGIYYYMTSLTDWTKSSATKYYTAPSPSGPWTDTLLPMMTPGNTADNSWDTQCDFIFSFKGPKDTVLMFCGDRWEKPDSARLGDYAWLPVSFTPKDSVLVNYYQDWEVEPDKGLWRPIDARRNLALRKTVTASSESGTNVASNVTDSATWQNYLSTKWISASSDPQWIMVDLGAPVPVNRVILKWDSAYAKSFKIQVATDTASWKDVYSTTKAGARSVTDETFQVTTARYVRMYGTQRGNTAKGYGLFDFLVLNDNDSLIITPVLCEGKTATSGAFLAFDKNTLRYHVPSHSSVKLTLVDGQGKLVAVLADGLKSTGDYTAVLPASLRHGIYLCRMTIGSQQVAVVKVRQ